MTLTGPGGVGKTRLALAAAERVGDQFGAGVVFVPLAGITRPEQVVGGVARAVGADLTGTDVPLEALAEQLGDDPWLLILDNLEQVIQVGGDLDELLARCPGVVILATSRTALGLLEEAERSLLEAMAVFVDGWTVQAAARVADLEEDRALELSEALARHSLTYVDRTELGPRLRMLETIRVFVAERLAARPDVAKIERRHADYYRGLAERADGPLRGVGQTLRGAGHSEWLERLQAEAGNLAAAVEWYLAHDPAPLPRLFRIL